MQMGDDEMDLGPLDERDKNGDIIEVSGDDVEKVTFDLREGLKKRATDYDSIDQIMAQRTMQEPPFYQFELLFKKLLRFIGWLNGIAGAEKPKEKTNGEQMATLDELFEGYEDKIVKGVGVQHRPDLAFYEDANGFYYTRPRPGYEGNEFGEKPKPPEPPGKTMSRK